MARKPSKKNIQAKEVKYTPELAVCIFDRMLQKLSDADRQRALDLAIVAIAGLHKAVLKDAYNDFISMATDNNSLLKLLVAFNEQAMMNMEELQRVQERSAKGRMTWQQKANHRNELIDEWKREGIEETEIYDTLLKEHFELVKGQVTMKKKDPTMTQAEVFRLWRRARNEN